MKPPAVNRTQRSTVSEQTSNQTHTTSTIEFDEASADLLELLGDSYTQQVLQAVTEQPKSARAVVNATEVSKVTAYRRLDRLEECGLVDSTMVYDSDGHHHAQYQTVCERITIQFGEDGIELTVQTRRNGGDDITE